MKPKYNKVHPAYDFQKTIRVSYLWVFWRYYDIYFCHEHPAEGFWAMRPVEHIPFSNWSDKLTYAAAIAGIGVPPKRRSI